MLIAFETVPSATCSRLPPTWQALAAEMTEGTCKEEGCLLYSFSYSADGKQSVVHEIYKGESSSMHAPQPPDLTGLIFDPLSAILSAT